MRQIVEKNQLTVSASSSHAWTFKLPRTSHTLTHSFNGTISLRTYLPAGSKRWKRQRNSLQQRRQRIFAKSIKHVSKLNHTTTHRWSVAEYVECDGSLLPPWLRCARFSHFIVDILYKVIFEIKKRIVCHVYSRREVCGNNSMRSIFARNYSK